MMRPMRIFSLQKLAETDDEIYANEGTAYPCKEEDLDSYKRLRLDNPGPFLSAHTAVQELVSWNHEAKVLSRSEWFARERLLIAVNRVARGRSWKPDIIIKESLLESCFRSATKPESSNKLLKQILSVLTPLPHKKIEMLMLTLECLSDVCRSRSTFLWWVPPRQRSYRLGEVP